MRVLLDTHVLLWALWDPVRLPPAVQGILRDGRTDLVWSAVGTVELAQKASMGRLRLSGTLDSFLEDRRTLMDLELLPVDHRHALRLATLPPIHGDPFDRLLVAQSQVEGIPLVTGDRRIREYSVEVIW